MIFNQKSLNMPEQSLSIPSYSRSHQRFKGHPQAINFGGVSKHSAEISHLNHAWVWQTVQTNSQQSSPIFSAGWMEILSTICQHPHQEQKVFELLTKNLDLIQNLPNELRRMTTKSASPFTKNQSMTLAWVLVDLGGFIWKFPHGQKASNREVAIACCETALHLLEPHKFSQVWGQIHNNLALAYAERLSGDRTANLLQAFTHYQKAVEVIGRQSFPKHWHTINS
jgi:hypothetical protein